MKVSEYAIMYNVPKLNNGVQYTDFLSVTHEDNDGSLELFKIVQNYILNLVCDRNPNSEITNTNIIITNIIVLNSYIKSDFQKYNEAHKKLYNQEIDDAKRLAKRYGVKTEDNLKDKLFTYDEVQKLLIKRLETMKPGDNLEPKSDFKGTDVVKAIEFGYNKACWHEQLVYERAINEIKSFIEENI